MAYSTSASEGDFATYAPGFQTSPMASASRTLGYIGLVGWLLPILGYPITFLGLMLGILGLWGCEPAKAVRASLICGVGLLLTVGNSLAGIYLATHGGFAGSTTRSTSPSTSSSVPASPLVIVNPHCQPQSPESTTRP